MNLVIRAHALKTESLSQSITGHFDERGGTIGRSDTNTLALPDPERHISRLQAEVWFSNGAFSIRNVGSANAISVNGRPINPGEGCNLNDGDELVVGSYTMRASLSADNPWDAPTEGRQTDGRTVIRASAAESRTNPRMQASSVPMPPSTAPQVSMPAAPKPAAASTNPFADLLGTSASSPSTSDPFAGLVDGSLVSPPTTAAHVRQPARSASPAPAQTPPPASFLQPPPAPAPARLPDDFDPFADLAPPPVNKTDSALASFVGGSPSASPAPSSSIPADLGLGDLLGAPASESGSSLDAMFGLKPGASRDNDPLAGFMAPSKTEIASGARPSTDPLAMFAAPTPPVAPAIPADFDHTPEMQGAYVPPAVVPPKTVKVPPAPAPAPPPATRAQATAPVAARPAPSPAPAPVVRASTPPARAATPRHVDGLTTDTVPGMRPRQEPFATSAPVPLNSSGDASSAALWAAFCEGAGIAFNPPQGLNPDLMKMIGQVLSQSVEGTLKLVAIRAAAKQELRADVTTIQARNNNPLKFSPDAGIAIQQLLQPPMRGFMVGPAAVTEVMDDLLGHAIGTMAGMRAALEGVLERFEPGQLEKKLSGNSVLDAVLPMNRRAKLWELYLQHYQRIHDEAQDDFHDLFGKAFINAYEEQLDRLDAARHPV
jgi:FHA domain-containing protein